MWMQIEGKWWCWHAVIKQFNWAVFYYFVHVRLFERSHFSTWKMMFCLHFMCLLIWRRHAVTLYGRLFERTVDEWLCIFPVSLLKCFSLFPCLFIPCFNLFIILVLLQGGTILGQPDQVHNLGNTEVTYQLFLDYLGGLGAEDFR